MSETIGIIGLGLQGASLAAGLKRRVEGTSLLGWDIDPAVRQRALAYFSDPSAMGLQDVQLVLAREEGFSSWTKLKAHFASGRTGERGAK